MRKINILTFIISLMLLLACSAGKKSLERGNYHDAILNAANRLSNDPDNRKASQVVRDGYSMDVAYYQDEIDKTLTSNDPFKWNTTLDIMLALNQMSDEISSIPIARKQIISLKTYTSELTDVQNKAAQEFYDAGMDALSRSTRETAKVAFLHFQNADAIVRGFKDTKEKMLESKDKATLKVVVELIPVKENYEYSVQSFYDNVFQMLKGRYKEMDFVHFFSPAEAERMNLKYPDLILNMEFYDFFMDPPQHFFEQRDLLRTIEEQYEEIAQKDMTITSFSPLKYPIFTNVAKGSMITLMRMVPKKGRIKIYTDQVASRGLLELKLVDFQSQEILFTDQIPGNYTWQNIYGTFAGDNEVLDKDLIDILNNEMILPPASQDMFVMFSKPIFNQLTDKLSNYFKQ